MTKRKLIYKPDTDSAELRTLDVSEVRAASDGTAQVLEGQSTAPAGLTSDDAFDSQLSFQSASFSGA